MDNKHRTLYAVLKALLAENDLLGWNVAPQKSGCVMMKIKVSNMEALCVNGSDLQVDSTSMPDHLSYKKISEKQTKRNYLRGQKFKQNPAKKLRLESPELPRSQDLEFSETVPRFDLSIPVSEDKAASNSECLDLNSASHDASDHDGSAYEECMADHDPCASELSVDMIQKIQSPESAESLIPSNRDVDECDSMSVCSNFSDNPRSIEPCVYKGCSYGPPISPGESREDFTDGMIYYCCECKNNPFLPDVRWCARCLICKNRHKKHKRHARDIEKHEPPLGHRTWSVCPPD